MIYERLLKSNPECWMDFTCNIINHQKSGPVNVKDLSTSVWKVWCPGVTCWWWGGGGWGWSSGRTRAGWCHTCSPPRPRSPTPPAPSGWGSVWGSVSTESNRRVTIVTSVCWTLGRPALKHQLLPLALLLPPQLTQQCEDECGVARLPRRRGPPPHRHRPRHGGDIPSKAVLDHEVDHQQVEERQQPCRHQPTWIMQGIDLGIKTLLSAFISYSQFKLKVIGYRYT